MARVRRTPDPKIQQRYRRLGAEIEKARIGRGLTQRQLGDVIGEAQTTISDYESGKTRVPLDAIGAIEDALQLSRGRLLIDSDHVRPAETSTATAIKRDGDLDDDGRELVLSLYDFCVSRAATMTVSGDPASSPDPEPATVAEFPPPSPDPWHDLTPDKEDEHEAGLWDLDLIPEDTRRRWIWEVRRRKAEPPSAQTRRRHRGRGA